VSDPFVAEIRMFGFNFAPSGWAQCNGQLLPISQNTALFSLLGTQYGGDGQYTFALPNLQGRVPMHHGQGQGLSERFIGEAAGVESVTLLSSEIPAHTHTLQASSLGGEGNDPSGQALTAAIGGGLYNTVHTPTAPLDAQALAAAGGSLPHNNMQPYRVVSFCIALQGIYPPRW
jgi:microcystin-dependent protein